MVSTSPVIAPADVPEVAAARVRRGELLHRTNAAPRVHLVLGEAAARRKVGGAAVLDEQLAHLEEVAALPHVTLQILPDDVGAHAALGTGFVLLTLEIGGQKSQWVYLEDLMRGECRPDQSQVNVYQLTFDSLVVNALGEHGTLQLLAGGTGNVEVEVTVAFDPDKAEWRKSSYSSGGEANCVETAFHDDVVSVRDSKDPQGGYLTLPREGWQGLLDGIRSSGEHQQDDEQLPPPGFG